MILLVTGGMGYFFWSDALGFGTKPLGTPPETRRFGYRFENDISFLKTINRFWSRSFFKNDIVFENDLDESL